MRRRRRGGFTLLEVVVALMVLELAVVGVLGTVLLASRTLHRAERLERAAGHAEAILDSLRGGADPDTVSRTAGDVRISWSVDARGRVDLAVDDLSGGTLLRARTLVPTR